MNEDFPWENPHKRKTLYRFSALLFHQQLVRDEGDELAVGRLVVLAVDVVAEQGVEVFDALNAFAFKALVAFFIALLPVNSLVLR